MTTRFVIISDTHNLHEKVQLPKGDVLVHCGDALLVGDFKEYAIFSNWFNSVQGYELKIFVPGNHDLYVEENQSLARSMMPNVKTLIDESLWINGLAIYGAPWTHNLKYWAFYGGPDIREKWNKIPSDTDILITHSPAYGVLDKLYNGEHIGCMNLMRRLADLKIRYHFHGHIHENYGIQKRVDGLSINAASCDDKYRPTNPTIVIDI